MRRDIRPRTSSSATPAPLPSSIEYALAGRQWVEILDHPDAVWLPAFLRALRGLGVESHQVDPTGGQRPASTEKLSEVYQAPRDNLPVQVTSFVGRERELTEVAERLRSTRLLTLTGSGGCGKTRLALKVASDVLADYPDGVWFVELAPIANPDLVPQTLAGVLGVQENPGTPILGTLTAYLRSRKALLILDNCEHLIDASARLADALTRSCPEVRILATSRELLGVAGETPWRVPPLAVPDPQRIAARPTWGSDWRERSGGFGLRAIIWVKDGNGSGASSRHQARLHRRPPGRACSTGPAS